jgi:DNA (cytosine-5)-methyltransferase 1
LCEHQLRQLYAASVLVLAFSSALSPADRRKHRTGILEVPQVRVLLAQMMESADSHLVLSLFPGAGLLDRGFAQAGFVVVRGPDTVFGQRIEEFSGLEGHFEGIIGGPPCQDFSRARRRPPTGHGQKMLNEFSRLVTECQPSWFLLENVPGVPDIHIAGYHVQRFNLFAWEFGCRQSRNRSFQFGSRDGVRLAIQRRTQSHLGKLAKAVLANDHPTRNFADRCELQGLPRWFDLPGLSRTAKIRAVGNGVPVPMAKAVAEAIRDRLVTHDLVTHGLIRLCPCDCGRPLTGKQQSATAACRKRLERERRNASFAAGLSSLPGLASGGLGSVTPLPCPDCLAGQTP